MIFDTGHGEFEFREVERESRTPIRRTPQLEDVLKAYEKQNEEINALNAEALAFFAKGEHDRALEICRRVQLLERGEFLEGRPNGTKESVQPAQPTWTKETKEDDSGPRQILRITKGSGLDGFRQTLIRELQDRLNTTRLNADPNSIAAPAVYKKGYQKGLNDCIALIQNPVYIGGKL